MLVNNESLNCPCVRDKGILIRGGVAPCIFKFPLVCSEWLNSRTGRFTYAEISAVSTE